MSMLNRTNVEKNVINIIDISPITKLVKLTLNEWKPTNMTVSVK